MTRILTLLIVLVLVSPVQAVRRSPDGTGEVLIVPYITARGDQVTVLEIANTLPHAKAVKVRFHEGRNGRVSSQFNLYLAPSDRWTASVFAHEGRLSIVTNDPSCTVPDPAEDPASPRIGDLPYRRGDISDFTGQREDGFGIDPERTLEGFVTVHEMGVLVSDRYGSAAAVAFPATAAHGNQPLDCRRPNRAFRTEAGIPGYWVTDPLADLLPPRGGLQALANVLNVDDGWAAEIPTIALTGFRHVDAPLLHTPPSSGHPNLADALSDPATGMAYADLRDVSNRAVRLRYSREHAIDAVSAVLGATAIGGFFAQQTAIDADTDWVLSMPTRHAYRDAAGDIAPFDRSGRPPIDWALLALWTLDGVSLETMTAPPACGGQGFDWPTSLRVMSFDGAADSNPSAVLASALRVPGPVQMHGVTQGRAELRFACSGIGTPLLRPDVDGVAWHGLPMIGFAVSRYRLANARPGVLATFADVQWLVPTITDLPTEGVSP